jgi:hypothetical protein
MRTRFMQLLAVLLLTSVIAGSVSAQTEAPKEPVYGWKHALIGTLTATQVAFTDWSQGGENALAWGLGIDGKSTLEQEHTNWANSYKFGFGQTRLGDQGIRKTDDRLDLESMLTYKMSETLNPYAAATLKTQFAPGYKYSGTGIETEVSEFFDPAFLTQSAGVVYQPGVAFKTRLGLALREVLSSKFGYADDPETLTEIEHSNVNGGLESVSELTLKIDDQVSFSSKLELFSAFKKIDQVILRSDNTLAAKVSKYITVLMNVQFLNERAVSPRTQIKETLALGLSYTFF